MRVIKILFFVTCMALGVACPMTFAQTVSDAAALQQKIDPLPQRSSVTITANASGDKVRITAPASVAQMHVEVFAASGEKLFDNEIRGGNVFDWHLQDGQAQRLPAGDYVCVVTVKNVAGRLTQKIGSIRVAEKDVSVGPAETAKLSFQQTQAIGPIEEDPSWTIVSDESNQTTTVVAHDGNDGQITRGRGALSFRIGDFFSGKDKEQMRLTEEGNLGIGTAKPKFKLDVAGSIRAREGVVFKDGSKLNVNDKGALTLTNSSGSVTPNVAGSGTTNQIAKWTPDGNTLGNSNLTEAASTTLSGTNTPLVGVNATINNTGSGNMAFSVRGATLAGPGEYPTGLDVAPTFAPITSINLAQGFTAAAFSAPPPGVTITDQFGGNSTIVYNNTSGAVTNGTNFNIASPVIFGALKPTTQTGLRIRNQGISGTTNSYGLYVDTQSGSTNNYAAVFAGGTVDIGSNGDFQIDSFNGITAPGGRFAVKQDGRVTIGFDYPNGGAKLNIAAGRDVSPGVPSISLEGINGGNRHWITTRNGGNDAIDFYLNDSLGQSGSTAPGVGSIHVLTLKNFQTFNPNFSFPRLGIGEINPAATLDLRGGSDANGSGNPNAISFQWRDGGFRHWISTRHNGTLGSNNAIDFYVNNSTTADGSTGPGSGSIQVMSLDSGKVGIGTPAPKARLHITDNGGNILIGAGGGCNAGYAGLSFASSLTCTNYSLLGEGTNTFINRSTGGQIIFRENNSDQMTILSGGFVGINTPSPNQFLTVNGDASKPGGGFWNTFSDERLKNIKGRFTSGLKAVMQLQPIRYEYKRENALDIKSDGEHIGFSAQAVQKVIPEAVLKDNKGYLLLNSEPIMWTMLNAIKEQQAEIERQEKQIGEQHKQIERLKQRISVRNTAAQIRRFSKH